MKGYSRWWGCSEAHWGRRVKGRGTFHILSAHTSLSAQWAVQRRSRCTWSWRLLQWSEGVSGDEAVEEGQQFPGSVHREMAEIRADACTVIICTVELVTDQNHNRTWGETKIITTYSNKVNPAFICVSLFIRGEEIFAVVKYGYHKKNCLLTGTYIYVGGLKVLELWYDWQASTTALCKSKQFFHIVNMTQWGHSSLTSALYPQPGKSEAET